MNRKLTFGGALASLAYERDYGEITALFKLNESDKVYLDNLRNRCEKLQRKNNWEKLCDEIPEQRCVSSRPFFEQNVDFFITYLVILKKHELEYKQSDKLINHLNNCFWCFEYYCKVMQNFYQMSQRLLSLQHGGDP